jgi:hypothetical protein
MSLTSGAERSMGFGVWALGFGLLEAVSGREGGDCRRAVIDCRWKG